MAAFGIAGQLAFVAALASPVVACCLYGRRGEGTARKIPGPNLNGTYFTAGRKIRWPHTESALTALGATRRPYGVAYS
eukprot:6385048-Prymnesium_polylepis.1